MIRHERAFQRMIADELGASPSPAKMLLVAATTAKVMVLVASRQQQTQPECTRTRPRQLLVVDVPKFSFPSPATAVFFGTLLIAERELARALGPQLKESRYLLHMQVMVRTRHATVASTPISTMCPTVKHPGGSPDVACTLVMLPGAGGVPGGGGFHGGGKESGGKKGGGGMGPGPKAHEEMPASPRDSLLMYSGKTGGFGGDGGEISVGTWGGSGGGDEGNGIEGGMGGKVVYTISCELVTNLYSLPAKGGELRPKATQIL